MFIFLKTKNFDGNKKPRRHSTHILPSFSGNSERRQQGRSLIAGQQFHVQRWGNYVEGRQSGVESALREGGEEEGLPWDLRLMREKTPSVTQLWHSFMQLKIGMKKSLHRTK
jgi:hypothetical protein